MSPELGSAGLAFGLSFEAAESFFVAPDVVGDGLEGCAQVRDLAGEPAEGSGLRLASAVFVDDGAELGIAVEGAATESCEFGDGGERDWLGRC
ncbi:MAG TPA: hypothetical protein VKP64_05505 [Mycobacteriales bacterium]|nr:hypothetical protein [Mycobacteriales bacterium]